MIKYLFLVLAGSLSCVSLAQSGQSVVKFMDPTPAGYSQRVEIDLGTARMVVLSGQVPLDQQGNTVGKGELTKQLEQTFLNIQHLVEQSGGTMYDVVKLNYYLVDMSQIQLVRNVRDKFVNTKQPPASTAVQVSRLFREDILVEIEATAIIPKKR